MQLCPCRNGHQNVILCFFGCEPGLFLQVSKRDTEGYLRAIHVDVRSFIYLPSSFSTVTKYLKWKNSMSSYTRYHFLIQTIEVLFVKP